MARTRAATYDTQRDAILGAAAAAFAQRGYAATSMQAIAADCGVSKATLYHYYRDKTAILVSIAETHVQRLHGLVDEVRLSRLEPEARLRLLIERFLAEYAGAQHAHRVLTEDVRFLPDTDRQRIVAIEREIVAGVAEVISALKPSHGRDELAKPLAMLLFGMINWMFTWLRPDGRLDHAHIAPVVADLFVGGLAAVRPSRRAGAARRGAPRADTLSTV